MIRQWHHPQAGYQYNCETCGAEWGPNPHPMQMVGVIDAIGDFKEYSFIVCHHDKTFRHIDQHYEQDGPTKEDRERSAKTLAKIAGYREHETGEVFAEWRLDIDAVNRIFERKAVAS